MDSIIDKNIELLMTLEVEDDWPPVAIEGVQAINVERGYLVNIPSLFIKGLSVNDIISVKFNEEGRVKSWDYIKKSHRSTIWLLRIGGISDQEVEDVLNKLRLLNCHTVSLAKYGCYSIDVPEDCSISDIDKLLSAFDESTIAIAYPSFRHNE